MKVTNIVWDTDGYSVEELGLPVEVDVPSEIEEDDIDVDEIEWLHDTEELITPEDNNGESTIEVYELDDKGKGIIIADNADPDKSNVEELRIAKGKFCPKCGGSLRFEHEDVLFTYYCSECGENFHDSDVQ